MKLFLLAAAAVIVTPALAQTTSPAGTMPPASDTGQTAPTDTPAQTPMDQSTTAPAQQPPMTDQAQTMPPQTTGGEDPVGGYQPSAPPMSGPMQPGATVTFQQAPSPDQAYPAPAPMAKYPICKKGEFDNCMQGKNSTHSREVHGRRSR